MTRANRALGISGVALLAIAIGLRLFLGLRDEDLAPGQASRVSSFLFGLGIASIGLAITFSLMLRAALRARARLAAQRPGAIVYIVVADAFLDAGLAIFGLARSKRRIYSALAADADGLTLGDGKSQSITSRWDEVQLLASVEGRAKHSITTWAKLRIALRHSGREGVVDLSVLPEGSLANPTARQVDEIARQIRERRSEHEVS
ncbi:hypothetical protein [Herbiconiux liangxiaofengii]|uniref:hypothetical protein n=1 Tax=Herbiconiux liangxiaofengii TaxID=3342795 RepID=UPI0035BB8525